MVPVASIAEKLVCDGCIKKLRLVKKLQLHQEKYNANSVIPHNVLASDYLTDCHQALFFQQDTLVY